MDNYKKILSILTLSFGMFVFCGVVLLKVEVWAYKQEAEIQKAAADLEWEGFLYRKTAHEILGQQL